ncbi:MAG TPA: hypothetical protein VEX13_18340, partial [Chloroflexia bacterium]|nr:hypothetical protein [Chloroflexia bacterium]
CNHCSPLWAAMKRADTLLWSSVAEPMPVPADFQAKVMVRLAASTAARPQPASTLQVPVAAHVPVSLPMSASMPSLTRPLGPLPTNLPSPTQALRSQLGAYARGVSAVALTLLGTVGLFLALVVSGTLKLGGPLHDAGEVVRTSFVAAETWVRSLFVGVGLETLGVSGLIMGLLVLVGWQVVASHYRLASSQHGKTAYLEALS